MIPADTKSDSRARQAGVEPEPEAPETRDLTKTHKGSAGELASEAQTEIDQLRKERDALYERLARAQAEFENARKRDAREQQAFQEFALADAMKSLLPVLDSFDWALQTPTQNPEELRAGIDLIRRQLRDALDKLGLRPIPATGEPFDPHLHEAVETVDSPDAEENHVLSELRRGYKLGTRLLRPSMVSVAKKSSV
jgi:molecular chaperone GrpE